jgi:lipoprotein-anchoring transpeptidase ErfK/SrfK
LCEVGQVSVTRFADLRACLLRPPLSRICTAARRGLAVAVLALPALALAAPQGEAQPGVPGASATGGKKHNNEASAARKQDSKAATAAGPLLAVVSIARQRIQVYDSEGLVAQAPVSSGMAGHRTPTGVFSILQKRRHHRSNIYSNAPMPYMQRLTWSGIALHAGVLPGYPASHGCIRLPYGFAAELWGMTRVGTRVVVAPDDAPAIAIEDPLLPAPELTPVTFADARLREAAGALASPLVPGPTLASAAAQTVVDAAGALGPSAVPRLTPWQRANAARSLANNDVAATAKAAKLAAETATARTAEARIALAALRRVELGLASAQRRRDTAVGAAAVASRPPTVERTAQALAAAEEALAEAQRAAGEARLIAAVRSQEAFEANTVVAEAEEARREAAAVVKAAERSVEPISVLVSRKAGRVYVRRAWEPVHEAPVKFTDTGPPLGTHVYLATGAVADGAALRWLAVSLPSSGSRAQRSQARRREPVSSSSAAGTGPSHETAAGALARFELPEATRRFIADRLWAGATLIVSEHGLSGETGLGTDFIVLAR